LTVIKAGGFSMCDGLRAQQMEPSMKRATSVTLALAGLLLASSASQAQAAEGAPDATFTLSGGAVAVGVGYTWGDGVLHYKGKDYPFSVSGLSVIDIGLARIDANGEVFNLRRIEDFPGTYVAAGVGATIAGGGFVASMENQAGVIMHMRSTTAGLRLNISAGGIVVKLKS
jgi:hypothetical protein